MLLVTLAALATGLLMDGSVATELRGGTSEGGEDPNAALVSGELRARLPGPDGELQFGLAPSALLGRDRRELFARASGEGDLRIGKRATARLRQGLGYGSIDFSPLAPAAKPLPGEPVNVQPPPSARFVKIEESNTTMLVEVAASRRLRVLGSASWVVGGGADAEARLLVPLARGPQAHATVEWSATRVGKLSFDLGAADTSYSNDRRASVASLLVGWTAHTSRNMHLALSVGPGIGRAQIGGQPDIISAYAVATGDLHAKVGRDLSVAVGASLEPQGDPLSGVLVERTSARALISLGKPATPAVSALLLASRVLTSSDSSPLFPQPGDLYVRGEVGGVLPLGARSSLVAGVRAAYLGRPLPGQPARQGAAFVRYSADLPLLR